MSIKTRPSSYAKLYTLSIQLLTINIILIGPGAIKAVTKQQISAACDVKSIECLVEHCESGLNFQSIKEFEIFLALFKPLTQEQLVQHKISLSCRHSRAAILELESLISTNSVCDPAKIDAIIAYHRRHFKRGYFNARKKPITDNFFTKYAIQVAHVCKKNLLKNLELGREELRARSKVFDEARERAFRDEPSIKANVKLIEEQPDELASSNVRPHNEAELTLSEYREALTQLRRPEDILTFERHECERSRARRIRVLHEKVGTFFKPALMCHQLARFYSGSLLSVARLANSGFVALDEKLDLELAENLMLRDWIVAVQVCEPMLFMRTESNESEHAIVDTCSERVLTIETLVYEDHFEDFDNEQLAEMIKKSKATRGRAQKLMKSAMKKMAKANLFRELSSGNGANKRGIFGKSIKLVGSSLYNPARSTFAAEISRDRRVIDCKFAGQLAGTTHEQSSLNCVQQGQLSSNGNVSNSTGATASEWRPDDATLKSLVEILQSSSGTEIKEGSSGVETNELDSAVAVFDPVTSLVSFVIVFAIMLTFEWLFFVVMTLAARICHRLYFNFDNLLTFPPKVLSWSDADFARFNERVEKLDEDDLFDYDELTPDEQRQRDLLAQVFGKPPPMIFKG